MSLRQISNGWIEGRGGLGGLLGYSAYRFHVSKTVFYECDAKVYEESRQLVESEGVAPLALDGNRRLWWTSNGLYWADADMTAEEVSLLLWDRERKRKAKIDRLRASRAQEEGHAGE